MGVEISEQDSEKLKKDAFHQAEIHALLSETQNPTSIYLHNTNQRETPTRAQIWTEGSGGAVLCCAPGVGPMDVTRSTIWLHHHPSILLHSHFQASCKECRSWACGIWADSRKVPTIIRWHQPSLDGCQAGTAPVLGTKGISTISPSPVYIVCSCKVLLLYLP